MEIKKKIIICYFIFFGVITTNCQQDRNKNNFYTEDFKSGSFIKIPSDSVKHLSYNLYKYKNSLMIADEYFKENYDKDNGRIEYKKVGYFLHQKIKNKSLNQIVDRNSYKELIEGILYLDKKNVYILPKGKGCFLCLRIIDLELSEIKLYENEYVGDNKRIYCIDSGEEIKVKSAKDFKTFKNSTGIVFGIDRDIIYSQCEPISISDFKLQFDNIPKEDIDSIISILK